MITDTAYSTEGPKCPHCGTQYTADDPVYYDEHRYTKDNCHACGKDFNVEVTIETSWTTSKP